MDVSYAVLVDGGFLKRKLYKKATKTHATADDIEAFITKLCKQPCFDGMRLHRVYYYDSKPYGEQVSKPLDGGTFQFAQSDVAQRNTAIYTGLSTKPFFAMRYGELHLNGWRLKREMLWNNARTKNITIDHTHLEPALQQKGVDMRIGLDIAGLTLKKIVQVIVLVTSDSDFIPAMKFARREGAQLFLVTLGHGVREGLKEHADLVLDKLEDPKPAAPPASMHPPA